MGEQPAFERFVAAVHARPEALPLDEAALCIAAHDQPELDIDGYLARLDDLAGEIRTPTLDGLVSHLFASGLFTGNAEDYYDPRNSFLNEVLDRRVGIPITLAVVGMEVGRRIGVPLSGVGMPGHFLMRDKVDTSVFIDPFNRGHELDEAGCRAVHRAMAGPAATWDPAFLDPIPREAIVARVLANLRAVYQGRSDLRSLRWVLRLRCALPGATDEDRRDLARAMAPLN